MMREGGHCPWYEPPVPASTALGPTQAMVRTPGTTRTPPGSTLVSPAPSHKHRLVPGALGAPVPFLQPEEAPGIFCLCGCVQGQEVLAGALCSASPGTPGYYPVPCTLSVVFVAVPQARRCGLAIPRRPSLTANIMHFHIGSMHPFPKTQLLQTEGHVIREGIW